ncbi:putative amidase-like protein [Bacillus oleivorans]|uniref:Putative amidase-like protein n=1 Tax=Bacillus oleivorans TaxID=1448271 RepID=A0A285CQM8_9BACI|nr:amidase domain-containing protein [Bacillus oleivorans]SNX69821.1 putative amidase-like protein [Bacillus oleivorans]
MKKILQDLLQSRLDAYVKPSVKTQRFFTEDVERKIGSVQKRKAEIVKVSGKGKIIKSFAEEDVEKVQYQVRMRYIINQSDNIFLEETVEERQADIFRSTVVDDYPLFTEADILNREEPSTGNNGVLVMYPEEEERQPFYYDRRKAVRYAESWWNSYNPRYKKFQDNCTNFISQCLHEGGGPMRGYPNRGNGWWMRNNNWSYSWTVANSLRLYLQNSKTGLRAKEVSSPQQLLLGDVICYDFQGDGRFDHNTIVVAKDIYGMPLVNANTYNSRMRYWSYEDSSAYTPNIKYKFYSIVDDY